MLMRSAVGLVGAYVPLPPVSVTCRVVVGALGLVAGLKLWDKSYTAVAQLVAGMRTMGELMQEVPRE